MKLCVLRGDGIGPEVTAAALEVLQASGLAFEVEEAAIGFEAYEAQGKPLPDATVEALERADAALLGAVTTPPGIPGYRSPILEMRQRFGLYANLRPCASVPHERSRPGIDIAIVRENSEGLYSGRERVLDNGDTAITERVITRKASERIVRFACTQARPQTPRKVTVVHKANVLRETCGLFRRVAKEVLAEFPQIEVQELLVDACAMDLLRRPESFDVIVTTNLFGDILSDEASMLVGGLGLACSANLGERFGVFEPVHGSAPDIAGQDKANPLAAILSAALLLERNGEAERATRVRAAVAEALAAGEVTADLGGSLDTQGATAAVTRRLR